MLLSKALRLFLDGIGRRDEYEFYLDKFQSADTRCFALVCPDEESVHQAADVLLFDLQFLMKLELRPVLLLAGSRETKVRQTLLEANTAECMCLDVPVSTDKIGGWVDDVFARQHLPILFSKRGLLDIALDLVPLLTRRMHLVRMRGALHQEGHGIVPFFNGGGADAIQIEVEDRSTLVLGCELLDRLPGLHISITSPMQLLPEIFTVKGAGTVLRRRRTIQHIIDRTEVDEERLLDLLGRSFGKPLTDTAFLCAVRHFYVEESYCGAALLEDHAAGAYLTKFAVGQEARGEGLAQQLWKAVKQNHAAMFWRSRDSNPINPWYERNADGRCRVGDWTVFWRGLELNDVPIVLEYCAGRPTDFVERVDESYP